MNITSESLLTLSLLFFAPQFGIAAEGALNSKLKTFKSDLGFSFNYAENRFEKPTAVACDVAPAEECPILSLYSKGSNLNEQINVYWNRVDDKNNAIENNRNSKEHDLLHESEFQAKYLKFDIAFLAKKETREFSEHEGGIAEWIARSQCMGHEVTVLLLYSPNPDKEGRKKLRESGKPPQALIDILNEFSCETWGGGKEAKVLKSPKGLVSVEISAQKSYFADRSYKIIYTYGFPRGNKFAFYSEEDTAALVPKFEIAMGFLKWSPDETVVLLYPHLISVLKNRSWSKVKITGDLHWLDERYALLDTECREQVLLFDSESGKEVTLGPKFSSSTVDVIKSVQDKKAQIRILIGSCTPSLKEDQCFELDLGKLKMTKMACPEKIKGPS